MQNLMWRASCRHVKCAIDASLTVILIASAVVGWKRTGDQRVETNKASVQWVHRLRLMHQYRRTTTTWLPSFDSRYWTWQKWLSSWQHSSISISMSRRLLLGRYLTMIRTSQSWIPKQSHLWWVSIAAPCLDLPGNCHIQLNWVLSYFDFG